MAAGGGCGEVLLGEGGCIMGGGVLFRGDVMGEVVGKVGVNGLDASYVQARDA